MPTKPVPVLSTAALLLLACALGGCALCHGLDQHHGDAMQGYWDHSNMRW